MTDQCVVLTRFRVTEVSNEAILENQSRANDLLRSVPGFRPMGVWEQFGETFNFLVVTQYDTEEHMQAAFRRFVESSLFEDLNARMAEPANITRFTPARSHGRSFAELIAGDFMSLSIRLSEPGYSQDMLAELADIFGGLSMIPGYLGSISGTNMELEDEVIGVAFWRDRDSYAKSVPAQPLYELSLYQRVL